MAVSRAFFILLLAASFQASAQRCYSGHCNHHNTLSECAQGSYTCSSTQFCEVITHSSLSRADWVEMQCHPISTLGNCQAIQSHNHPSCDPTRLDQTCHFCCADANCVQSLVQGIQPATTASSHAGHWSYLAPSDGIGQWGVLFPTCNGQEQSPIDLASSATTYDSSLQPFVFSGLNSSARASLGNNGHNVQATLMSSTPMLVSGGSLGATYRVMQFHWHWGAHDSEGSEHTVDGHAFPMEVHIVCENTNYDHLPSIAQAFDHPDALAVLSFFFRISPVDNPNMTTIINALAHIPNAGDSTMTTVRVSDFMASTDDYYRYHGSLTTPECNQVVTWTVFRDTIPISDAQLAKFRLLLDSHHSPMIDNFRPQQDLNGRVIKTTFSSSNLVGRRQY